MGLDPSDFTSEITESGDIFLASDQEVCKVHYVSACSGSKGPPLRFKRATSPFQKGHPSVSKGPPFRFKRATSPFQKGHLSVSKGPPLRFKRATSPFQKGHHLPAQKLSYIFNKILKWPQDT